MGIYAQEPELDLEFDNIPLKEALLSVEKESGYYFYFLEEWVAGARATIDRKASLEVILEQLLAPTLLNFYIQSGEKKVFLLPHSHVVDDLPEGFFQTQDPDSLSMPGKEGIVDSRRAIFFVDESLQRERITRKLVVLGKASEKPSATYQVQGLATLVTTGEPLQDLLLRLKGSNKFVVTDSEGRYSIELAPGYHTLVTSGMGTAPLEQPILVYGHGTLDLVLEEGVEDLEEVIVQADALKNLDNVTSGETNIGSEESKNVPLVFGERDLLQVARSLPGISSAGEGANGINVRGGKTDQTLVLLDDAVLYNPTHFFGIFQALNPFTTDEATIYKGAMPVKHGGRLSSVFDIHSIDGNRKEIKGEGSIGPVTSNLALQLPLKENRSSLVLGGRGVYSNWVLNALDDTSLRNTTASFYDGIARYHTLLGENAKLSGTAYYSRDEFNVTTDSIYQYSNALASVRWDHNLGDTRGHLTLANSDYRFQVGYDGASSSDFNLTYGINQTQLKYVLRTPLSEKHILDYGVNLNYYSVNPGEKRRLGSASTAEEINIPREQAVEAAIYAGDEFTISPKLKVDLGLRLALYSAFGTSDQRTYEAGQPRAESTVTDTLSYGQFEPVKLYGGPEIRLASRYIFAENWSVKASLGNAYQFLHTLSNNTTVSPIDTWKLSDLNLKPQKGYYSSLGIYHNLADNQVEVSLEGYYKRMQDVLDFRTGANLFLNPHVETEVLQGEGKSYGLELLIKKKSGKLNGWLGYTLSRAMYRFDSNFREDRINDGEFFPSNFDRPHDISLIGNYRITRRYSVSLNAVYQTGRPITYPVGSYRLNNQDYLYYSERNKTRIPDYFRIDLGVNIEGNHKLEKLAHSFWTLSVYNILGRNNPYSVYFVTDAGEVKALQTSIFAIPVPSITYNFKF